jgi:L-alanine-DL-glutamate epimerase-like enolase superfamily enzyme
VKISDVTITVHRWDAPRTRYHHPVGGPREVGVVAIETDEGITGHSFLGNVNQGVEEFAPQLLNRLKPLLVGRDPLATNGLWYEMWARNRLVAPQTIGAVDVALWDLKGKAAGMPIHQLLGTVRERVPAYASSQIHPSVEAYVEQALGFRERGWQAYKIHPFRDPKRDLEICVAVKKAIGDSMVLMLDSTWSYCYEDALRIGLAIQEMGYYWYEDPLNESDLYNYVKLKQKLTIPILATEYTPGGMDAYTPWITQQATDMLRGDVAVKAGLTPMIKIAHLAEGFRMKCEIHHGGNSLNNVANLHLLMAIRNCDFFEVLLPDEAQKYGLVQDIEVDGEGYVHAPTEPGLGYQIDWELVERNKVGVLR